MRGTLDEAEWAVVGPALGFFFFFGEAEAIATSGGLMGFQRIIIAVDGSEAAARAVDLTAELATALGAQVAIVHVIDPKLAVAPDAGVPADR